MTEEPLITQDDIEALKLRDSRWRDVEMAIKIDEELRNSPTVNLILDGIERRAKTSLESLIDVDPLNVRLITSLQEKVKCARFVTEEIKRIKEAGVVAQHTLEEEGDVELEAPHDGRS